MVLKSLSKVRELITVLLGKAGLRGALCSVESRLFRGCLLNQVTQAGLAGRIPCAQIPRDLGLNKCQAARSHLVRDCSMQAAEQQTPAGLAHGKGSYASF